MPEYLSIYNTDNNPGYVKHEEVRGDLKYTYFTSKNKWNTFQPSFIIFIEYTGKENIMSYGYNGKFLTKENHGENSSPKVICGFGASGGQVNKRLIVVGDRDVDSSFTFEIALYNTECKSEELSEGAFIYDKVELFKEEGQ